MTTSKLRAREGQGLHAGADAVRLGDIGERSGAQIEADGTQGGGQHAAAEHLALAAAGVEDGLGLRSATTARRRSKKRPITKRTTGFLSEYFSCRVTDRRALPGARAQAQDMADVLQRMEGVDLALAAVALAHFVAALVDLADVAANQDFHQALVAERVQLDVGDGGAAHQVAAAERI